MLKVEDFDIDKVDSLNFDKIKDQLSFLFQGEEDIANFINFLKNIKNFVNLSNDKRHMLLIDLGYFKSQIQIYEQRISYLIRNKKNNNIKQAIKKAKCIGEKITENVISYYEEEDSALAGLEELHILVLGWSTYMQDLYYMCGQTNKNVGNIY